MTWTYRYPRPALTVDCVIFGVDEDPLQVLLVRRASAPYQGVWALPGGFVDVEEPLEDAARRELAEETGVSCPRLEQLRAFGAPGRDPRERVVSVAFYGVVNLRGRPLRAASDARDAAWFPARRTRGLAFDHDEILETALGRLEDAVRSRPLGPGLLPESFPLASLRRLYEIVLGRPLDGRRFRRQALKTGWLTPCDDAPPPAHPGAARLYRFEAGKAAFSARPAWRLDT